MTVVDSQLFPRTIRPSFATPFSDARDSRDNRSSRDRAALSNGADDECVPVPTPPQQWPRVFPGL
jgi:hypothetical protein